MNKITLVLVTCLSILQIRFSQAQTITTLSPRVSGISSTDLFGSKSSISADGNRIAIGAPGKDVLSFGSVKIYDRINNTWVQVGSAITSGNQGDDFGMGLSLSADGTTVAVGAPATNQNAGEVRVFRLVGNTWTKIGDNDLEGSAFFDQDKFGSSVSLNSDGTILAVGSPGFDRSGARDAGVVEVFQFNGVSWVNLGNRIDGGTSEGDNFGSVVSINAAGNRVAIGSPLIDVFFGTNNGKVDVYELFENRIWIRMTGNIAGRNSDDFLGVSLDLNAAGDTLITGVSGVDISNTNSGEAQVWKYNGSVWETLGNVIEGPNSNNPGFGTATSISADGKRVAIGALRNDERGQNRGQVRVYELGANNTWQLFHATLNGAVDEDEYGASVDLSADGKRLIVGARQNNSSGIGYAEAYDLTGSVLNIGDFSVLGASLYPNPTTDYITIKTDKNLSTKRVTIYDINSRVVKTVSINTNNSINVTELKAGIYFMQLETDKGTAVSKFVKQ